MLDRIEKAVKILAYPVRQEFWQDMGPDEGGRKLRVVWTPALLDQLRDSVGSTSGGGRGGSEKRTRNLLDAAAVELWHSIRREVKQLYSDTTNRDYDGEVKEQLIRWFQAYKNQFGKTTMPDPSPNQVRRVAAMLNQWVHTIESKFDPPRQIEILGACPKCKARKHKVNEEESVSALVALLVSDGPLSVVCRACGERWSELHEIHALGSAIVG